MGMINRFNPTPGALDFWHEFRKPTPYKWPILGVSGLMTFGLMYQITSESVLVPPAPPEVTYIASFPADRTDAEIIASNIDNQRRQDAVAALMEQNEERKRELYRALGRASGMDVEEIDRKAAEERAAIEAAENARKAEIRRRAGLPEEDISEAALRARAAGQEIIPETDNAGGLVANPDQ
ncbi:hypothetical protein [Allopontixanthobacter sp.]|uniref:hypothetical protein n=1 Tax=Allopontixanthobacter sp. TaxID=2906452 RepID=UPI002ABA1FF9|nr:hypothetical protein [Allopontixanthobacter sp.]MDZ4306682.1 hypothetical protein [Allopontixanthobacter sp.]